MRLALLLVLVPFAACNGNPGIVAAVTTSLRATPPAFAPGSLVLLRPVFTGVSARIDPGVGPVESGRSYRVGPVAAAQRYTLTVAAADGTTTATAIDVPLHYRESVAVLPDGAIARTRGGAATLADGSVLLVGGAGTGPTWLTTAERVDTSGAAAPVGDTSAPRAEPSVVPVPGGVVLAVGGASSATSLAVASLVEGWDPVGLAWSSFGNLACRRTGQTATWLADSTLLVAGGVATGGLPDERDAELWVPGLGSRQPDGEMLTARSDHSATLLADGRVLLAGGTDANGERVAVAECYDPVGRRFVAAGAMVQARARHAAVALADGRVLLIGGVGANGPLASVEWFDPATDTFTATGALAVARSDVRAVRLPDGDVLVAGGTMAGGRATDTIEVWSAATGSWRTWAQRLPAPRTGHVMTLLPDARIAVLGGDVGRGFATATVWLLE